MNAQINPQPQGVIMLFLKGCQHVSAALIGQGLIPFCSLGHGAMFRLCSQIKLTSSTEGKGAVNG